MIVRPGEKQLQCTVPRDAHTLEGFRAWAASEAFPDGARISLIQGKLIIDMSPERIESHNQAKAEIGSALYFLVKRLDLGKLYPDGAWVSNDQTGLSTEPDATFASWECFEQGRVKVILRGDDEDDEVELCGSPDWVLEVVSPTSVAKDTEMLLVEYFAAGVREYWLIDARGENVEFTAFTRGEKGFVPAAPHHGWIDSPVFGRQFRLDRERDRIGGWRYTLHVREGRSQG